MIRNAFAVVGIAVGLAVAAAPVASADEQSYLNDINGGIGAIEVTPGTWMNLGYTACDIGNLTDATTYIYNNTGSSVTRGQAQYAAESAFMYLC